MEPQQTTGRRIQKKTWITLGLLGILSLTSVAYLQGNIVQNLQSRFTRSHIFTSGAYQEWVPSPNNPAKQTLNVMEMEKLDVFYRDSILKPATGKSNAQHYRDLKTLKEEIVPKIRSNSQILASPNKARLLAIADYFEFEIADFLKKHDPIIGGLYMATMPPPDGRKFGSCGSVHNKFHITPPSENLCREGTALNIQNESGQMVWTCGGDKTQIIPASCHSYELFPDTLQFRLSKSAHLLTDDAEFNLGDTLYGFIQSGDINKTTICIESTDHTCDSPTKFVPVTSQGWEANHAPGRLELNNFIIPNTWKTGSYTFHITLGEGATKKSIARTISLDTAANRNAATTITFHSTLNNTVTSVAENEKFTIRITGTNGNNFTYCMDTPVNPVPCYDKAEPLQAGTTEGSWTIVDANTVEFKNFQLPTGSPKGLYQIRAKNGPKGVFDVAGFYLD